PSPSAPSCGACRGSTPSLPARSAAAWAAWLLRQRVPARAREAADERVGRREPGHAVRQGLGNVLRVGGQDEERALALEDDAGVHEAARAGARLVRDLRAERQLRGQPRLELLPREDVQAEPAQLRRAAELARDGRVGRALPDQLEEHALVVGRGRRDLLERVLTAELGGNAEAVRGARHADGVAPALDLAEADEIDD